MDWGTSDGGQHVGCCDTWMNQPLPCHCSDDVLHYTAFMHVLQSIFRDTVGTFVMAQELAKSKLITCVHKHYTVEQVQFSPI